MVEPLTTFLTISTILITTASAIIPCPKELESAYGRRRDCSRHRHFRTVRTNFSVHGSSVHDHV